MKFSPSSSPSVLTHDRKYCGKYWKICWKIFKNVAIITDKAPLCIGKHVENIVENIVEIGNIVIITNKFPLSVGDIGPSVSLFPRSLEIQLEKSLSFSRRPSYDINCNCHHHYCHHKCHHHLMMVCHSH